LQIVLRSELELALLDRFAWLDFALESKIWH
jgi:hypothetical protein